MTAIAEVGAAFTARIARARLLASAHPATAELLDFSARLATWQHERLSHAPTLLEATDTAATPWAARFDTATLATHVPVLLAWLADAAPSALQQAARGLDSDDTATWQARLAAALTGAGDGPADATVAFVCDVVVQPWAEVAARSSVPAAVTPTPGAPATCPCCGGLPVAGVLRERGHGAGRALVCGRCLTEWAAPRMMCPACGGLEVEALPVFRAEAWPAVRLDACDACRAYLKSVDLTVDGQALAVVDDLATLPLDLWAAEQGFHKLRPNLLRL